MESHTLNNAEANRVFWDSAADVFYKSLTDLPDVVELYKQLTQTILSRCKFDPQNTLLMDFACGNGALSMTLAPHCKAIVGVDISQGMVDAYNKQMQDHGIATAHAIRAELQADEPQLSGQKFDAILCSQSYHHIPDSATITEVLASYLKPNGVLLVANMIRGKHDFRVIADMKSLVNQSGMAGISHPRNLMAHINGYVEEDMKVLFEGAGLAEFTFEEAYVKEKDGKSFGVFLAKGARPS